MKKMNFEQMEAVNGGAAAIDWCRVGKWVTGIGIVLISVGVPPAGAVAAAAYGTIVGATTIFC